MRIADLVSAVARLRCRVWLVVTACGLLAAAGCASATAGDCHGNRRPADQIGRASITQGIAGNVWEWVGFHGGSNGGTSCGTVTAVVRTLLVYPLTPRSAVPGLDQFTFLVGAMPGAPLDSVRSDSSGFYQLSLPPGTFSLVVREGTAFYVNVESTSFANVGQITVLFGTVSRVQVDIVYRASF